MDGTPVTLTTTTTQTNVFLLTPATRQLCLAIQKVLMDDNTAKQTRTGCSGLAFMIDDSKSASDYYMTT
jgi:hypothetical protein